MTTAKNSKAGFTLVELLVVITIIGILAGLAMPGVSGAMKLAKKARAGAMIQNLRVALTAYESDYGAWPDSVFPSDNEIPSYDSASLYQMLIGDVSTSNEANPRGTVYMEFNKKDLTSGGGDDFGDTNARNATGFKDPWRSPYWIKVCKSYDNQISGLPARSGGDEIINASVAIWSVGFQGGQRITEPNAGNRKEYIISW